MIKDFLYDKNFLKELDQRPSREIFAKVISLTTNEEAVDEIQGKVTAGTISLDGSSAVRRTCNFTMVNDQSDIMDYYWGFSTKFRLYIGLTNDVNDKYDDIIWFPQGTFVISDFRINLSANTCSIQISGKDKMCLLNGEIGGNLFATTTFSPEIVEDDDGNTTYVDKTIKDIIKEMIHAYAKEPFHNIILNDLDDEAVELLSFKGEEDLYFFKDENDSIESVIVGGDNTRFLTTGEEVAISDSEKIVYDQLGGLENGDTPTKVYMTKKDAYNPNTSKKYTIIQRQYGESAGYRSTELTWPDSEDLIGEAGDTITSILDKIIETFGDYEYFYNMEGQFVFQKKRSYINTTWNNLNFYDIDSYGVDRVLKKELYAESSKTVSEFSYNFSDSNLITVFSNTPKFADVKNDFIIWGKKKSASGGDATIDIHMRCAIDEKPTLYKSFDGIYYSTSTNTSDNGIEYEVVDWREIIYQMSKDWMQHNHDEDYESVLGKNNPDKYLSGRTGYEQYYTDLYSFWRLLYAPIGLVDAAVDQPDYSTTYYEQTTLNAITLDKQTPDAKTAYYIYRNNTYVRITELSEFQDDIDYYIKVVNNNTITYSKVIKYKFPSETCKYYYFKDGYGDSCTISDYNLNSFWHKNIVNSPESLLFWFDFIDPSKGELAKYSVKAIGDRTKVVNDDTVKVITYKEVPTVIYISKEDYDMKLSDGTIDTSSYTYVFISSQTEALFDTSTQGKSAQDELDNLIYQNAYCNEEINIQGIPIYYLEPNTKISIIDSRTNINGKYIINKISLPLTYNGSMSITATKAPTRLY